MSDTDLIASQREAIVRLEAELGTAIAALAKLQAELNEAKRQWINYERVALERHAEVEQLQAENKTQAERIAGLEAALSECGRKAFEGEYGIEALVNEVLYGHL